MIIGIGNDIVNIGRIKESLDKFDNKFVARILSVQEIEYSKEFDNEKLCKFIAKRFAAKEAFAKALGTGIAKGISFNEIIVSNDELGAPFIHLVGKTEKIFKDFGDNNIHVSLSDDEPFALATVIISRKT